MKSPKIYNTDIIFVFLDEGNALMPNQSNQPILTVFGLNQTIQTGSISIQTNSILVQDKTSHFLFGCT